MESKVNYVVVGVFVVLLGIALIGGILWLSSGWQYRKAYDLYLAYMNESVSGLNLNAPVKYMGVTIGNVNDISIDSNSPQQVRLLLNIERDSPIKTDTVAILRTQGLTGIAYIELAGGSSQAPLLKAGPGEKYPVIKTGASLMTRLDTSVSSLLANLNRTVERVNAVLDAENQQALKRLLADSQSVATALAAQKHTITSTVDRVAQASKTLPQLITQINKSAIALEKMSTNVSDASITTRKTFEHAEPMMKQLNQETLPEIKQLLSETRAVAGSVLRLSEQLEQDPSVILRGKEPASLGPGE